MVSPKVEDVLTWLAREEINLSDPWAIRELQGKLAAMGLGKGASWSAILDRTTTYLQKQILSKGVVPYAYEFGTGTQVRFTLPGQRGAFGYKSVAAKYSLETFVPRE